MENANTDIRQLAWEHKARADNEQRILEAETKAAEKEYFSASPFGQKLARRRRNSETGEVMPSYLIELSEAFEKVLEADKGRQGGQRSRATQLVDYFVSMMNMADDRLIALWEDNADAPYWGPRPEKRNPFDILAVITFKTVVDSLLYMKDAEPPRLNHHWQRIGKSALQEVTDAYFAWVDPDAYHKASWYYLRSNKRNKNQSNGYQQANIGRAHSRARLSYKNTPRWSVSQQVDVGKWCLEIFVRKVAPDLFTVEEISNGYLKNGLPRKKSKTIAPTAKARDLYRADLDYRVKHNVSQWPLVAEPLEWELTEDRVGRKNRTGGYHVAAHRHFNPLVRAESCLTDTAPEQMAINFVNQLGNVELQPNLTTVGYFEYAMDHNYSEDDLFDLDMPLKPAISSADLRAQSRDYKENGNPEGLETGTEEHDRWKARRRELFADTIEMEQKVIAAETTQRGVKSCKDLDSCFLSWSYDWRLRVYPQQMLLNVQGAGYQKALLRFAEGDDPMDPEVLREIHEAIGAAYQGTRISLAERERWSRDNIERICGLLDGTDGDIVEIARQHPDDLWEAATLTAEYREVVLLKQRPRWQVGLQADASQSGAQIFGVLARDLKVLKATGLIAPAGTDRDTPPPDAYALVGHCVLGLLQEGAVFPEFVDADWRKRNVKDLDPNVRALMIEILRSPKARNVYKNLVMCVPYGAKTRSLWRGVRKALIKKLGYSPQHDLLNEVTTALLAYGQVALRVEFPALVELMYWLEVLAGKALDQRHDLEWYVPDGSLINFRKVKPVCRRIPTLAFGTPKVAVGDSTETLKSKTKAAFAPSLVHSLDGQLLRYTFENWERPFLVIHDCVRVLPSDMQAAKKRFRAGLIHIGQEFSLEKLATNMGVSLTEMDDLPKGSADLQELHNAVYGVH